jgi:hypothetical protein
MSKVLLGKLSIATLLLHRIRTAAMSELVWENAVATSHAVFSVTFNFLDQDGKENQHLTLQGFCSNVHSALATSEYFGFLVWDNRDPALLRIAALIKKTELRGKGKMCSREFESFVSRVYPHVPNCLALRLFRYLQLSGAAADDRPVRASQNATLNSVLVEHCAAAAAFLDLSTNRDDWVKKVGSEARVAAQASSWRGNKTKATSPFKTAISSK